MPVGYHTYSASANVTLQARFGSAYDPPRSLVLRLPRGPNTVYPSPAAIIAPMAAMLVQKAIGERLTCIFVDHGMLRQGEVLQVVETFDREMGMRLVAVNAIEEYLDALEGVTEPERKRSIIGEKFIRIFERERAGKEGEGNALSFGFGPVIGGAYFDLIVVDP